MPPAAASTRQPHNPTGSLNAGKGGLAIRALRWCSSSAWTLPAAPCEPVCPVEAIYYEDDLPDRQHSLISYYS